jgi:uncharacterized protein (DUF736 family)
MATQNTNTKSTLIEIGAGWKRVSKGNENYINGVLKFPSDIKAGQEIPYIIFSNKNKKAENQPDLRVYLSDKPGTQKTTAPVVKPTPKVESTSVAEELF